MTIAPYEPDAPSSALVHDPTGGRLVAWAAGLEAAGQLGRALCATTFAPKHYQGKPAEAAAAILFGDEIGLSPAQSLRSIYVISGTPALYARSMAALVMAHGHEIWTVEDTPSRVTVAGRRRGTDRVEQVTWTVERARKAGYTSNQKYLTDPQAMLYARALGDVARRIAPDVLAGIAYTVEEMESAEPPATVSVVRSSPVASTAQRKPLLAAPVVDEPALDEPPPAAPAEPPAPEGITDAQLRKLAVEMRRVGIADRAERLAYVSGVIGRDVGSSKELTKHEASVVIDDLAGQTEQMDEPTGEDPS